MLDREMSCTQHPFKRSGFDYATTQKRKSKAPMTGTFIWPLLPQI